MDTSLKSGVRPRFYLGILVRRIYPSRESGGGGGHIIFSLTIPSLELVRVPPPLALD